MESRLCPVLFFKNDSRQQRAACGPASLGNGTGGGPVRRGIRRVSWAPSQVGVAGVCAKREPTRATALCSGLAEGCQEAFEKGFVSG